MTRPKISVVIATHNRAKYFRRSLSCYARQTFKDFEIILLDDGSDDEMEFCCRALAQTYDLDLKHFWFKRPGGFRDCGSIMNYGIRAAAGDFIICTSPEVMPGRTLLHEMMRECGIHGGDDSLTFFTGKCYLLTQRMQQDLDTVDWRGLGVAAAVRKLPDFYNQPSAEIGGHDAYQAKNIDAAKEFVTNMVGGMTRKGWRNMGGFVESDVWGPGDLSWLMERNRRGVPLVTLQDLDSISVHQNHDGPDDIITPRDMDLAMKSLVPGPWDNIRW